MVVNRTDLQLENVMRGVGYGDAVGSILHIGELSKCAHCMTLYIQVKMSSNCNTRCCKVALSTLCSHCMETQLHL
jgi:hypothetical protein